MLTVMLVLKFVEVLNRVLDIDFDYEVRISNNEGFESEVGDKVGSIN